MGKHLHTRSGWLEKPGGAGQPCHCADETLRFKCQGNEALSIRGQRQTPASLSPQPGSLAHWWEAK